MVNLDYIVKKPLAIYIDEHFSRVDTTCTVCNYVVNLPKFFYFVGELIEYNIDIIVLYCYMFTKIKGFCELINSSFWFLKLDFIFAKVQFNKHLKIHLW